MGICTKNAWEETTPYSRLCCQMLFMNRIRVIRITHDDLVTGLTAPALGDSVSEKMAAMEIVAEHTPCTKIKLYTVD